MLSRLSPLSGCWPEDKSGWPLQSPGSTLRFDLTYLQFSYLQLYYVHRPFSLWGPTQAVNASVGGRVEGL